MPHSLPRTQSFGPASALLDPFGPRGFTPSVAVVASDREWAARAIEEVLRSEGYLTLRATTGDEAAALCAAANPDVVFVEQRFAEGQGARGAAPLRDAEGLALCRRLRRDRLVSDAAPIVVTTADAVSRADLLAALAAGAWDLHPLPGDTALLLARCATWVRAKRHADRSAEVGLSDPETGLYNLRGLLRRTLEIASAAPRVPGQLPFACAAFRASGAAPGGGALTGVVDLVRAACHTVGRGADTFARVGRRDFAVVAPGTTAEGVGRLLDRLRVRLSVAGADAGDGIALRTVVRVLEPRDGVDPSRAVDLVLRSLSELASAS